MLAPLRWSFSCYSYLSLTWTSHDLGFTDGSRRRRLGCRSGRSIRPFVLCRAPVWIAGFDLSYAAMTSTSIARPAASFPPLRIAPRCAAQSFTLTALAFAALGTMLGLGALYWVGWSRGGLLIYTFAREPDGPFPVNVPSST